MKMQALLGIMAALLAGIMAAKKCPTCDPDACTKLNGANCLAGVTKDECGCCDVCAKLEGESCDISSAKNDPCGDGLECRDTQSTGPVCQCLFQDIVCGSDNKTYTNLCQLLTTAVREQRANSLNYKRMGPCDPGTRIVTKPEYVRNHTHTNVVLQCEAMGMPAPAMTWIFTRADNQTYNVPGDDWKMVTSSRGGPGKYMATSWLQIEDLEKAHEGDYTCVAMNKHHKDHATARIKVVELQ